MPKAATIERFIEKVEANLHVEAVESFYSSTATLQDNRSETRGKKKQIEIEKNLLQWVTKMYSKCIRPYFINEDNVVIKWHFIFEFRDNTFIDLEELAYQEWKGELIEKEQFFFDPIQRLPKQITQE